ncbi:hypothetical protein L873DRAFT_1361884 [Choiromyces venosus 120613-1]|uniref:Uncharacterized protein n=1 Tax=Choiromyces venosus 120613-1 TaxID=1336337 RepID=A0A3N4K5L1_9PEZI|nr:hypothetical protein L873DRAFT_1361884 [Choiromyces venosus 120613-1]
MRRSMVAGSLLLYFPTELEKFFVLLSFCLSSFLPSITPGRPGLPGGFVVGGRTGRRECDKSKGGRTKEMRPRVGLYNGTSFRSPLGFPYFSI